MTTTTDFDRLLGSVLEADGPQGVPPGLVEAALVEARTVDQRRPIIRLADPLGWPPIAWPVPWTSRGFTLVALVALLTAGLVALALIAGTRPPRLVGDGERIYVWANGQAHLVTTGGVTAHTVPVFRGDGCATLVPGTSLVTRGGFGQWHVVDLTTGQAVGSVSIGYAGGERWAPGVPRLAQFDLTGRVGITTFVDPTRPDTRWIPVEGVVDVDWSLDGERLAAIAIREGVIHVVVIDGTTDDVATVATSLRGQNADVDWASNGSRVEVRVSPIGRSALITALVDVESGASSQVQDAIPDEPDTFPPGDGALSPDGERFAWPTVGSIRVLGPDDVVAATIPTTGLAQELAWSSDGRRLAFRDGDRLGVAEAGSGTQVSMALAPTEPFAWYPVGDDLIVARQPDGRAIVERYGSRGLQLIAWQDLGGPTQAPPPSDPAVPFCLQLDAGAPAS